MKDKIVKILTSKQFAAFCTALLALIVYLLTMTSCSTFKRATVRGTRSVEKNVKSSVEYVFPPAADAEPQPEFVRVSYSRTYRRR